MPLFDLWGAVGMENAFFRAVCAVLAGRAVCLAGSRYDCSHADPPRPQPLSFCAKTERFYGAGERQSDAGVGGRTRPVPAGAGGRTGCQGV